MPAAAQTKNPVQIDSTSTPGVSACRRSHARRQVRHHGRRQRRQVLGRHDAQHVDACRVERLRAVGDEDTDPHVLGHGACTLPSVYDLFI